MKIHYPKLCNMAHAFKGSNLFILFNYPIELFAVYKNRKMNDKSNKYAMTHVKSTCVAYSISIVAKV